MKRRSLLAMILSLVMCLGIAMPAWAAEDNNDIINANINNKYDKDFFNQLRLEMVEEALQDHGVIAKDVDLLDILPASLADDTKMSSETIFAYAETLAEDNIKNKNECEALIDRINALKSIPVTFIDFELGQVFNSENSFIDNVQNLNDVSYINDDTNFSMNLNDELITPYSKDNPIYTEINGGKDGVFERRQLDFLGFDKITSNLTLPTVTASNDKAQCWIYYGFDSSNGYGIEAGFAHQTSDWLPYVKYKSGNTGYVYADRALAYDEGMTVGDCNLVIKEDKSSSSTYKYRAYLSCGTSQLIVATTLFDNSDMSSLSVKHLTTIAKVGFDGSNITRKSMNAKFTNVNVRKLNATSYKSWDSYSEYSEWKEGILYGTADCTKNYVHRNNGYVSLYK